MGLDLYNKKRNFKKTAEPKGVKAGKHRLLEFVVQKHNASRLHYDFRLEMDGVLKSWAVPKGPSLNPEDKRLAIMVEDHPYDYKNFEGNIPEGNYGAGNVIVWDKGTYEPAETDKDSDPEKILSAQLQKGHLRIILRGKKLKGEFNLIHMKGRGENNWLLTKKADKYASTADILEKDKSVLSRYTVETIDKTGKVYGKATIMKKRNTNVKPKKAAAPTKKSKSKSKG